MKQFEKSSTNDKINKNVIKIAASEKSIGQLLTTSYTNNFLHLQIVTMKKNCSGLSFLG
jgi:hypothetical protein